MREFPSQQEILELFEKDPQRTFRLRELVLELELRSSQARELKSVLKDLARSKKLVYLKKNHYALVHKGRYAASEDGVRRISSGREEPRTSKPAVRATQNVVSGRLIGHRVGYGFVVPDSPLAGTDLDIFIPPDGMGSALHGDRVEVHFQRSTKGFKGEGRMEGRVIQVLERAQKTVVGQFHAGPRYNYVMPFDQRIPFEIVIPDLGAVREPPLRRNRQFGGESEGRSSVGTARGQARGQDARATAGETPAPHLLVHDRRSASDLDGLIVDVEITNYPRPAALPRGRVIEVLGRREEFGVDVEIMIRKFHLPHRFPADVLAEADSAPQYVPESNQEGRRDFRGLPIVTIDGETAKDFDDAVYVEQLAGGHCLLHVHIADVAHYVRPGTALDREARLRGTSVYFPDRAVPMLPLELSNGICSLNPHVDRLVMSALMEFDSERRLVEYELLPGIIRSADRMTYTAVRDILAGKAGACQRYAALVPEFKRMEELARLLARRREERGSIDFDLPEPEIEFDEHGRMTGITRSERNFAHRIIEEFMLAANEAVASYLEGRGIPSLYRIHEKPDAKKVIEFEEIAAGFGYSLGIELPAARRTRMRLRDERERYPRFHETLEGELKISSYNYQRLTQRLEGKPEERILSYLMLRSLKQARYSEENVGHFALAAPTYTHFTSPIRRYPDLIVHRILKAALAEEGGTARTVTRPSRERDARAAAGETPAPQLPGAAFVHPQELHALGIETSESERRAADAERELIEWKKVLFMAQHVGDEFEALIISLIKHGFFVELTDLFVEGFVPLSSLA
ncbi:MAG: VacB/RNase II family 3'-5' exoribonuclease, partial [Terriglobia bacterium]